MAPGSPGPRRLTVRPAGPLGGAFQPPGDKSITHRALLIGALARGETVVENPNPGADCAATRACIGALGAPVTLRNGAVAIEGCAMRFTEPDRVLDCGNSGTTLRLLAGPLAAQPFLSVLQGDASLNQRPVGRVIDPLRRMGAQLWARDGNRLPPLVIRGDRLRPIHHALAVPSAQAASCVLLAGLFAAGATTIDVPGAARDHTQRMLGAFGIPVGQAPAPGGGARLEVQGLVTPVGIGLRVPGDFSAAAFFLAAAAAVPGARVTANGVGINASRIALLDVLREMGAEVECRDQGETGGEPYADVTVTGSERLRAFVIPPEWVPRMLDEVPAWAIAATAAHGASRLTGADELRVKESDRLAAIASNLAALGIRVEEHRDGLTIEGGEVQGGTVHARHDHRIAMAFALLAGRARAPVIIEEAEAIDTSYPAFARDLRALGGDIAGNGEDA